MDQITQIRNAAVIIAGIMIFRFVTNTYSTYLKYGLTGQQIATAVIGLCVVFAVLFLALGLHDKLSDYMEQKHRERRIK